MKELCVRCGKETDYDINTPITARLYFVEGAGQLCEDCWMKLWPATNDEIEKDFSKGTDKNSWI